MASRSADIPPCVVYLWGYIKDRVFVPPLPRDLADLKARITTAVKNIDAPMLTREWQERISYQCLPCQPWCIHRTSLFVKKKNSFHVAVKKFR
jgi:hypothetical protein